MRCCRSDVLDYQVVCVRAFIFVMETADCCFISHVFGRCPVYSCSARIGIVFTPPVISFRALFCVVSRAFRVEPLAVIRTSFPYFMTDLMYVLYVMFIVSCVLHHAAPASRFMCLNLWFALFTVRSTRFFQDSLLSMYTPKYFVLSLFGYFWLWILR